MASNSTKIRPLGSYVLVKRARAQSTKGGILLPDTAQEKPKEGFVMAVGPGSVDDQGRKEEMFVKEGERVLFSSYSGTEVKSLSEEDEYLILSQKDILGVLA